MRCGRMEPMPEPTNAAGRSVPDDAIVLVDKPAHWTSHDVVARARRVFGTRRVGHAGTLDPMATGLLILGIERGTKLLTHLVGLDKVYSATIRLGQTTITDDAEGEVTGTASAEALAALDEQRVRELVDAHLTGEIDQVPSAVSAIKVDGVRSYARVRSGQQVELKARAITIYAFEITAVRRASTGFIDVDARVHCSSGTYIRALARDLGQLAGVGGHLIALRRISVGPFSVDEAGTLPGREVPVEQIVAPPTLTLADAAGRVFPVRALDDQEVIDLGHGKRLRASAQPGLTAAVDAAGRLRGILTNRAGQARSVLVLPIDDAPRGNKREG